MPNDLAHARPTNSKAVASFAGLLQALLLLQGSISPGGAPSGDSLEASSARTSLLLDGLLLEGLFTGRMPPALAGINPDPESDEVAPAERGALLAAFLLTGLQAGAWNSGLPSFGFGANWPRTGVSLSQVMGLLSPVYQEGLLAWVARDLGALGINSHNLAGQGETKQAPAALNGPGLASKYQNPEHYRQAALPPLNMASSKKPAPQDNGLLPVNGANADHNRAEKVAGPGVATGLAKEAGDELNAYTGQGEEHLADRAGQPLTGLNSFSSNKGEAGPVVNLPEVIARIVERLDFARRQGRSELEIKLKPENLGSLHLKLIWQGGRLGLQILVENRQVGQALESSLPDLRRILEQQGVNVGQMEVQVGSQDDLSRHFSFRNLDRSAGYPRERPVAKWMGTAEPVSEMVPRMTSKSHRINFLA